MHLRARVLPWLRRAGGNAHDWRVGLRIWLEPHRPRPVAGVLALAVDACSDEDDAAIVARSATQTMQEPRVRRSPRVAACGTCSDARLPRHRTRSSAAARKAFQAEHGCRYARWAALAQELGPTLAHVEGVASFYHFLHLRPVGRLRILFSDNITDRMLGSEALMADCARAWACSPA